MSLLKGDITDEIDKDLVRTFDNLLNKFCVKNKIYNRPVIFKIDHFDLFYNILKLKEDVYNLC